MVLVAARALVVPAALVVLVVRVPGKVPVVLAVPAMALALVTAVTHHRRQISSPVAKASKADKPAKTLEMMPMKTLPTPPLVSANAADRPTSRVTRASPILGSLVGPVSLGSLGSLATVPALVSGTVLTRASLEIGTQAMLATLETLATLATSAPQLATSNLVDPAHWARLSRRRNNNELQLGAAL